MKEWQPTVVGAGGLTPGPGPLGFSAQSPSFQRSFCSVPDTDLTPQRDLPSLLILSGCVTHDGP